MGEGSTVGGGTSAVGAGVSLGGAGAVVVTMTVGAGAVCVTVTTGRGATGVAGCATMAGAGDAGMSVDVTAGIGAVLAAGWGWENVSTAIPTTMPNPTMAAIAAAPLMTQPDVEDVVLLE